MRKTLHVAMCLAFAAAAAPAANTDQSFSLQTGPPAAAMPDPTKPGEKKVKDVAFVVRSIGCTDVSTFRVSAVAEGGAAGARRTAALRTLELPSGVFAVAGQESTGTWVVAVSAVCGREVAGATVKLVNGVYRRDAVELLSHPPAAADIERAFTRQAGGGRRP